MQQMSVIEQRVLCINPNCTCVLFNLSYFACYFGSWLTRLAFVCTRASFHCCTTQEARQDVKKKKVSCINLFEFDYYFIRITLHVVWVNLGFLWCCTHQYANLKQNVVKPIFCYMGFFVFACYLILVWNLSQALIRLWQLELPCDVTCVRT